MPDLRAAKAYGVLQRPATDPCESYAAGAQSLAAASTIVKFVALLSLKNVY